MSHDQERRRGPRVKIAAFASLETCGRLNPNNQALCAVRDISRTGIGLETGQPPIPGQTVILRLAIDDRTHELLTQAIRVKRRGKGNFYQLGLDWSRCSPEQLAFLDELLQVVEQQRA
jgi:hypothetical protein